MGTMKKSITINAPVEKVFDYAENPENFTEIWPSLEEVKNIKEQANGGQSFDWVYKMAGIRLSGSSENIEYVRNERTVARTSGGIESTITWEYQAVDGGTKFTATTEYKIPIPVLGKLAESVIIKMEENGQEVLLANLKARMEA